MTKRTLLIATRNLGKIREIKEIFRGVPYKLRTLNDIGFKEEIQETGKSFEENAIIKAKIIGEMIKIWTLAEDSGLEVDALGGRPGILSARYCEGTDLDRINKLVKELKGVPEEKRTAKFKAVVALYIPRNCHSGKRSASRIGFWTSQNDKGKIITFEGIGEGWITEEPRGSNGFGYDPIFLNLDLGKTNGEASLEEKNRVSHRARALNKLKDFLRTSGD